MNTRETKSICLVCEFPPPPGGMSGQAVLLEEYLKRNKGFDVKRCKINVKFPQRCSFLERSSIAKILLKFPVILFRMIRTIPSSDVVHIFSICGLYFYVVVAPAVLIAKLFKKRVVVNYHAGHFYDFYAKSVKFLVRRILLLSDYVTTPLMFLKDEFLRINIDITQVSNLIDLNDLEFIERTHFGPRLISTRHLRHVYGNDVILRAFSIILKRYPSSSLVVAGDGDNRNELEQLSNDLGISQNVTFTGYVDKQRLIELYNSSDIFVNASRRDNMPISILEAFSLGLPVVTTDPMGIPYFVDDNGTGLLSTVDDAEALAENIIKIIDHPEIGKCLASSAKKYIDSLNWDNIYPQISRVYFD